MNELKNFKKKKLAEFDEKYQEGELWYESVNGDQISLGELRQFISDLIDEIEKAIPKPNAILTPEGLSEEVKETKYKVFFEINGHNKCREEFLTNLNS